MVAPSSLTIGSGAQALPSATVNATVLAIFAAIAVGYMVFLLQARAEALVRALGKADEVNDPFFWVSVSLDAFAPYNGAIGSKRKELAERIAGLIKGEGDSVAGGRNVNL